MDDVVTITAVSPTIRHVPPPTRQVPRIAASSWVQALPPATRFILRGGPDVMAAAGKALGLAISQIACRAAKPSNVSRTPSAKIGDAPDMVATPDGGVAALWLGPDEQLLLAPVNFDIGSALESVLRELPHSLVEVSHRQTALEVSGPRATLLLNAGCPLDFDLKAFPVGMCTRTVLAKAEIVLWRTSQDVFHVEVWRSFADYVSGFLAEIARELAS